MAELTPYQAKYLRHFLVRKYVRYEDVQLELIDHLATSIEQKMSEDKDLTFDQALDQVYKGFGVGGFAKIVKEKEKAMRKFWRRHIWEVFLEFLQPPLIYGALALYGIFYFLQEFSQVLFLSFFGISGFMVFILVVGLCYHQYVKEDKLEKFLFYKSYQAMAGSILYTSFYLIGMFTFEIGDNGNRVIFDSPVLTYHIGATYFTINLILVYILMIKVPKGLLTKFKTQYAKYNLA